MKNTPVVGRIGAGIVALVLAWAIGGYIANTVFQNQPLLNKMETSSGKIGASIAILGVAFLLGRYPFGLSVKYLFASLLQRFSCSW
jgi:hypothetical protein